MRRALVLLALLLAAAFALERAFGARTIVRGPRIERLVAESTAKQLTIAAVSLRDARGGRLVWARQRGLWRLAGPLDAVCDARALEGVVQRILGARAVVRARGDAERARYGFGSEGLVLELLGPKLDALLALDLGATLERGLSSFVARPGSGEILEVDVDLRTLLATQIAPGFPPLVDPRVCAGPFPGADATLDRVFVDLADGRSLELARVWPDSLAPGEGAWSWRLYEEGIPSACPAPRAEAFLAYLLSAPFTRLEPPGRAAELGFERPATRLTLIASGGDSVVIEIARSGGKVWARNVTLEILGELEPAIAALFEPTAQTFLDLARPNPWDEWLRARFGAGR